MHRALTAVIGLISGINAAALLVGRGIGIVCVALMVAFILIQVFYRYVLGNALPWSEEAARFLMLWMMGLMAPTAFRRGGFVSIQMISAILPRAAASVLSLLLLGVSLLILIVGAKIGHTQVTGFAGRFATDTLWVPTSVMPVEWMKVPRSWAMASLLTGVLLMISVNVELMLRTIAQIMGLEDCLPPIRQETVPEAV
jgi:TRAP-type C4-dicarboxylate transport system permease small subunit